MRRSARPRRAEPRRARAAQRAARSTAHRLAGQLVQQGVLERGPGGWRLGVRLFELGHIVPRQQHLREVALAYMEDLYEADRGRPSARGCSTTARCSYVEIISGHRKVPSRRAGGGRMPAHCTALGKTLLAFSDDAGADWLSPPTPLAPRTPRTARRPRALRRELYDIRRDRLAYDREEASLGLTCVAAPILTPAAPPGPPCRSRCPSAAG